MLFGGRLPSSETGQIVGIVADLCAFVQDFVRNIGPPVLGWSVEPGMTYSENR